MKHPLISPPGVFGGFAKRRFELVAVQIYRAPHAVLYADKTRC